MKNLIGLALTLLLINVVKAQEITGSITEGEITTQSVTLKSGEVFKGRVAKLDSLELSLLYQGDTISFLRSDIERIDLGNSAFKNTNSLRRNGYIEKLDEHVLLLNPTAIPLEKGTKVYTNVLFSINSIQFGVTKNISMGASVVLPFIFGGNVRAGFKVAPNLHLGVGSTAYVVPFIIGDLGELIWGNYSYGMATYGNQHALVNVGGGIFLGTVGLGPLPAVSFGGQYRISRKIAMMTDNMVVFSTNTDNPFQVHSLLPSVAMRYQSGVIRFDAGFAYFIPYLALGVKF